MAGAGARFARTSVDHTPARRAKGVTYIAQIGVTSNSLPAMGELPRLPVPFEHHILKWACNLSPVTSRALFGKPPKLDGQTLTVKTMGIPPCQTA